MDSLDFSSGYSTNPLAVAVAGFAVYSLRIAFIPWLWNWEGLGLFIPVISPVYRQGEHWQTLSKRTAIVAHVIFGTIMLCCALLQFNKSLRHKYAAIHRTSGRLYVVSGLLCVVALYVLRDTTGAGSSSTEKGSIIAQVFIDTTASIWTLTTLCALIAAKCRSFQYHRVLMTCSFAAACTPILQRLSSWAVLAPAAIALRCIVCMNSDAPFIRLIETRWGPPGDSSSLVFGSCSRVDNDDPRAQPYLFSLDGYGEAEQASFPLSTWTGLVCVLAITAGYFLNGSESDRIITGTAAVQSATEYATVEQDADPAQDAQLEMVCSSEGLDFEDEQREESLAATATSATKFTVIGVNSGTPSSSDSFPWHIIYMYFKESVEGMAKFMVTLSDIEPKLEGGRLIFVSSSEITYASIRIMRRCLVLSIILFFALLLALVATALLSAWTVVFAISVAFLIILPVYAGSMLLAGNK